MKNSHKLLLALPIVLLLCGVSYSLFKHKEQQLISPTPNNLNNISPVIFIHGSGGDENNMIPFAQQLNKNMTQEDVLKIKAKKDGNLDFLTELSEHTQHPYVFIGYEDSNAPIQDWAAGLAKVVDSLNKTYHFKSYKLIGFSNGGLAGAYYIESSLSKKYKKEITHLALLGAPFNDLEPITEETLDELKTNPDSYFKQFSDTTEGIPNTLKVLSIAGDDQRGNLSDGIVPISSAYGSRLIFKSAVDVYQEKTISASHGELISPDNEPLIEEIATFLAK